MTFIKNQLPTALYLSVMPCLKKAQAYPELTRKKTISRVIVLIKESSVLVYRTPCPNGGTARNTIDEIRKSKVRSVELIKLRNELRHV